jgi:hypothetical protein
MENFARSQFRRFFDKCNTEALRSLSKIDLKYFQPLELQDAIDSSAGSGKTVSPSSADRQESVLICLAAKRALVGRRPDGLINLVKRLDLSKGGLFAVFRYLLSDSGTIGSFPYRQQLSEAFRVALDEVYAQVEHTVQSCPELDREDVRLHLFRAIAKERQLLTGVGLFSHFFLGNRAEDGEDSAHDDDPVAFQVGRLLRSFLARPNHLTTLARLYGMEWCYAITFAALLLNVRAVSDETLNDRLRDGLDHIREQASRRFKGSSVDLPPNEVLARLLPSEVEPNETRSSILLPPLLARISSIMDALTPEPIPSAGLCLSAIRRDLVWPRPQHTFCAIVLTRAPITIKTIYTQLCPDGGKLDFSNVPQSIRLISAFSDLVFAGARLEQLASYTKRVITATPENREWTDYFLGKGAQDFDSEISLLTQTAQLTRSRHEVYGSDVKTIEMLCDSISKRLWGRERSNASRQDPESELFRFIGRFECNLVAVLGEAVEKGRTRIQSETTIPLSESSIGFYWTKNHSNIYVLADRVELLMAFENYVANFRYSNGFRAFQNDDASLEIGRIEVQAEEGENWAVVQFTSLGEGPESTSDTTMEDFRRRLIEMGCTVTHTNMAGSFVVKLTIPQIQKRALRS